MKEILDYVRKGPFGILLAVCLASYSSAIVLQAFNADDIIQGQPISEDYNTFLAQGRWGYYAIYKLLLDANPLGPAALIAGIVILAWASTLAAFEIPLRGKASRGFFITISTISLYWAHCFSYDSTRIAYPTATLLAVAGYALARRKRYLLAILCLSIAPAIYQASIQVFLTLLCASLLMAACRNTPLIQIGKAAFSAVACLVISMGLYILSTKVIAAATNIRLDARSSIDPLAALAAHERIVRLLAGHSLPNGYQMPYFTLQMQILAWILMILFFYAVVRRVNRSNALITAFLSIGMLISPFALAFATPLDEFSPRALIAFSTVFAMYAAAPMELLDNRPRSKTFLVVASVSVALMILTSIQINGRAFDEYLSSRNDILATSRMIPQIEKVVLNSSIPIDGPIPIVVRYREAPSLSPRGHSATSRAAPWSKEWIFRQIDPRFVPVRPQLAEQLLEQAPNAKWPEPASIYVSKQTVVVLIN